MGKTERKKTVTAHSAPFFPQKKIDIVHQVTDLAEPLCRAEGMELVHVEYHPERGGKKLRIYIDKPDGVGLNDCIQVSRQLSDLLDVYVETDHSYRLEVSSPGPDRPLGKKNDFERFKGCNIKITSNKPIEGQKKFTGLLLGLTNDVVNLMTQDKSILIPYTEIKKANLINYNGEI